MNLPSFLLILVGVLLNAGAQLALKASVRDTGAIAFDLAASGEVAMKLMSGPWLWVGLACYGISVVIWILALSRVDVSIAYPMLSIGYVVNAFAAWSLFGEALSLARLSGIGLIIAGVFVLARS
ncbi:MAG: 4-amino-4-deoxy-L-arabinose transferase [Gammaproteobacteria bacterium]|nr:4-amino-4-deoxy-L-arabinose transferase [Gammaproteobacteria bacterium]